MVEAFLAAARSGDFDALLAMLDPDAVVRADVAAVRAGASSQTRGAEAVATLFATRPFDARLALVDGSPGLLWAPAGRTRAVFTFTFTLREDKIVDIDLIGDPARLRELALIDLWRAGR